MKLVVVDEFVIQVVNWFVAGIVGGTVNGMITGLWLVWLLSLKQRGETPVRSHTLRMKR